MSKVLPSVILCLALASLPAAATSFVLVSDENLTDQATAVVEARVEARDHSPASGMPATDYMISVERLIKGSVPGSALILRVPGGVGADGIGLEIFGAPRFEIGEQALLFLRPGRDGTFRILHLMQGAFRQVGHNGRQLAMRSFGEAREIQLPGESRTPEDLERIRGARDLEAFATWVTDRARGVHRPADYFVELPSSELSAMADSFTFFDHNGRRMRWFDFDNGQSPRWFVHNSGQPGLSKQELDNSIRAGIGAWNGISDSNIRYAFGGTSGASGGLSNFDGVNAVLFEDPNDNDTFDGPFLCNVGGTLAIGGPWFDDAAIRSSRGEEFHPIANGDVVTNKGIQCVFDRSPDRRALAAELFGHELGHTLGFGHSCGDDSSGSCNSAAKNDALMRAFVHDDRRGARLSSDDLGAARNLYPGSSSARPAAPSNLAAVAISSSAIRLSWQDNSTNEDSFKVEMRVEGGTFATVFERLDRDVVDVTVENLAPATTYTFRVRARNSGGLSPSSNEASATTPTALPASPSGLTAVPLSRTAIRLSWQDNSDDETGFQIEASSPTGDFAVVATAPEGSEERVIDGLVAETPYTFRLRATNPQGLSLLTGEEASATTLGDGGPCTAGDVTLCLLAERFEVKIRWRNQFQPGDNGVGRALPVPGSDATGSFFFFKPDNIEILTKMVDGRAVNGAFWFFYGGLSTVEYWITVRDIQTGESRTYHNPPGELCGNADVRAFFAPAAAAGTLAARPAAALTPVAGASGSCVPGPTTACLLDGQFRVEVDWDNPRIAGNVGSGNVVPGFGTEETAFFWFFRPDNIELAIKVIDARRLTGTFWVFYGALTDVEYDITVTDTLTGQVKAYHNEPFNLCGANDLSAF